MLVYPVLVRGMLDGFAALRHAVCMDRPEDVRRWVASETDARTAAFALVRMQTGTRRFWVVLAVLFVVGCLIGLTMAPPLASLVIGALYAAGLGALIVVLTYVRARRSNAKRIPAGTVVEGEVSDEAITFRHPLASTTFPFAAIISVRTVGEWVFVRQVGGACTALPRDLFPSSDWARVRAAVESRG